MSIIYLHNSEAVTAIAKAVRVKQVRSSTAGLTARDRGEQSWRECKLTSSDDELGLMWHNQSSIGLSHCLRSFHVSDALLRELVLFGSLIRSAKGLSFKQDRVRVGLRLDGLFIPIGPVGGVGGSILRICRLVRCDSRGRLRRNDDHLTNPNAIGVLNLRVSRKQPLKGNIVLTGDTSERVSGFYYVLHILC